MLELVRPRRYLPHVVFFLLAALTAGCSSVDPLVMSSPGVDLVWPAPPNPPKIKFLRDIKGPEDIYPEKTRIQQLSEVMVGETQVIQELLTPYNLTVSDSDIVYIADTIAGIVHRYDLRERDVAYIGMAGDNFLSSPVAMAVDNDQSLYVADSINAKVYKFGKDGNFIGDISPPSEFKRPAGIAISRSGEKFIVDVLAGKLHKFSKDDRYLGEFPKESQGVELNTPTHVALDGDGNVFINDSMNFVIRMYSEEGKFIRSIGDAGDVPGTFSRPKGIALDSDNNLYVVDANHDNIQIFNRKGELLLYWGENGAEPGKFYLPSGVYIDKSDRIFIADTFNRRIQVFQYLKAGARK